MTKNKHGLVRDIPEPIKRQIRQAAGFGCIICGLHLIEYHHVDTPYADAREHDPKKITLLCKQHHTKATNGFLSNALVKEAMLNPFCKKEGYANEFFQPDNSDPIIVFGGITIVACPIPIQVKGEPLFEVKGPEEACGPFRLSANFSNARGNPSLRIVDNEWRAYGTNWDAEVVGTTITIRDSPRHISLKLIFEQPNTIRIERLDMYLNGYRFIGSPDELVVQFPRGNKIKAIGWLSHSNAVGVSFA